MADPVGWVAHIKKAKSVPICVFPQSDDLLLGKRIANGFISPQCWGVVICHCQHLTDAPRFTIVESHCFEGNGTRDLVHHVPVDVQQRSSAWEPSNNVLLKQLVVECLSTHLTTFL